MALSSTSLFHFTKRYDTLVKILKEGLQPRYCVEYDWGDKDLIIPMICTCDIPLSETRIHVGKYGKYGIGLNKSFAKACGFTPVFYISNKCMLYKIITKFAESLTMTSISKDPWNVLREEQLLYYVKRTTGTPCDREHLHMSKLPKFSNEKEWRYIPEISDSVHMNIAKKGRGQDVNLNALNRTTQDKKIELTPDDITYVFVSSEGEREKLINDIKDIARSNPKWRNKESIAISKIISCEQIQCDF